MSKAETKKATEQTSEQRIAELEAKLAKAEKTKAEIEEKAVEATMKAIGMRASDLDEIKEANTKKKEIREFDIGRIVVSINGVSYTGRGQAPSEVVEVIMSMAGNKRMRELRAKIGNNHEIFMLAGGGFRSRIVGQSDESIA